MKKAGRRAALKTGAILMAGMLICSSMTSLIALADEETSDYATVTNILEVDPVYVGETITIEEEPVVEFEGTVTEETPSCEYLYTAEVDGSYYFSVTDVKANCSVDFYIYDSLGNKICSSADTSVTLEEGETYTIRVKQYKGNTPFTVQIKSQKPTIDITNATLINDQIMFKNQKNVYSYTAPVTGTYRFSLADSTANIDFKLMAWNKYDTNILNTTEESGTVEFDAGETYEIQVRYSNGIGSYTLKIDQQKPTADISGYTDIDDTIEHADQINYYKFVAPVNGDYYIGFSSIEGTESYTCRILDHDNTEIGGNSIFIDYDWNRGNSYNLAQGEEYTISMKYSSGYGSYTLVLKYPISAQEYLENFAADNIDSIISTNEVETESISDEEPSADTSETNPLQQQIDELESELADLQEENDRLKEILDENEIIYD